MKVNEEIGSSVSMVDYLKYWCDWTKVADLTKEEKQELEARIHSYIAQLYPIGSWYYAALSNAIALVYEPSTSLRVSVTTNPILVYYPDTRGYIVHSTQGDFNPCKLPDWAETRECQIIRECYANCPGVYIEYRFSDRSYRVYRVKNEDNTGFTIASFFTDSNGKFVCDIQTQNGSYRRMAKAAIDMIQSHSPSYRDISTNKTESVEVAEPSTPYLGPFEVLCNKITTCNTIEQLDYVLHKELILGEKISSERMEKLKSCISQVANKLDRKLFYRQLSSPEDVQNNRLVWTRQASYSVYAYTDSMSSTVHIIGAESRFIYNTSYTVPAGKSWNYESWKFASPKAALLFQVLGSNDEFDFVKRVEFIKERDSYVLYDSPCNGTVKIAMFRQSFIPTEVERVVDFLKKQLGMLQPYPNTEEAPVQASVPKQWIEDGEYALLDILRRFDTIPPVLPNAGYLFHTYLHILQVGEFEIALALSTGTLMKDLNSMRVSVHSGHGRVTVHNRYVLWYRRKGSYATKTPVDLDSSFALSFEVKENCISFYNWHSPFQDNRSMIDLLATSYLSKLRHANRVLGIDNRGTVENPLYTILTEEGRELTVHIEANPIYSTPVPIFYVRDNIVPKISDILNSEPLPKSLLHAFDTSDECEKSTGVKESKLPDLRASKKPKPKFTPISVKQSKS